MDRILTILLYPFFPFFGFLCSLRRFKSLFGYLAFLAFAVFLHLNNAIRSEDDIYRHISNYNFALQTGSGYMAESGPYLATTVNTFAAFNLPPIYIYVFWCLVYYTGFYLCLRLLLHYVVRDRFSILLFACAVLFISPVNFLGIRFFTGAYWFIYLAALYEIKGTKLLWTWPLVLTPLIHFAIAIPVICFYLLKLSDPKLRTLLILICVTWVLSFVDLGPFYRSFWTFQGDYYLSEARNEGMRSTYRYGQYLYLPYQLLTWFMLYLVYRRRRKLDPVMLRLLKLSAVFIIMLNLVAVSYDAQLRYRSIMDWFNAFTLLIYYRTFRDRRFYKLALALPFALLLKSWNFLFVAGPILWDTQQVLFSSYADAWSRCVRALNRVL